MKFIYKILYTFLLVAVFAGCRKEDTPPSQTAVLKGHLLMHLHIYVDETEVDDFGITYTTSDGRAMSLNSSKFYLSDIELVKADGSLYKIGGIRLLKELGQDVYDLGDVPAGNYRSVRFKVGVDSLTNATPAYQLKDSSLFMYNDMRMGTGGSEGFYAFLTGSGLIDTTADLTGSMAEFNYQIGTNAHYTQVIMPDKNFSVVPGQTEYIHLLADYYRLFNGINLSVNSNLRVNGVMDNSSSLADQISVNISNLFKYEE